jgi:excisionase family DNA binding protein
LVPQTVVGSIPDDRLFTVSEIAKLLQAPRSVVYAACDRGELEYMKFEGVVQVEGRHLKSWLRATAHPVVP